MGKTLIEQKLGAIMKIYMRMLRRKESGKAFQEVTLR